MPMYNLNLNWFHVTTTRGNLYSVTKCAFRTYSLYSDTEDDEIIFTRSDDTWVRDIEALPVRTDGVDGGEPQGRFSRDHLKSDRSWKPTLVSNPDRPADHLAHHPANDDSESSTTPISTAVVSMDMQRPQMHIFEAINKLSEEVDARQNDSPCCAGVSANLRVAEEEITKLQQAKNQMAEEICKLKSELSILQSKMRSQEEMLDERYWALATERSFRQHLQEQLNAKINGILVAGSSIITDLDESWYKDTKVIAISVGLPGDVTKVLQEECIKKAQYKRVKLVVGGNQIGDNCDKVEDTVKDVRHTVKIAQQLAPEVDICELPPRINSKAVTQAVAALNMGLQEMAMESGCNFVSTKEIFTLANGNPNEGYILNDGMHLNARGSTKLVECLQIPTLEQANRKVTRMAGYRRPSDLFPNGKLHVFCSSSQATEQTTDQKV